MTRQLAPAAYNGVKTAWKQVTGDLGGVEATASAVDRTKSLVSEYGTLHSDRFPPADVILDAEALAGEPRVTAALARAQGYILMPVEPRGAGDLALLLARLGRDVSKLFGNAAEALQDGVLTAAERDGLARDLDEVVRVVTETRMHLMPAQEPRAGRGKVA